MRSFEKHHKEKKRREKVEKIFNHHINGDSFFQCSSYVWKTVVFKNYNKIKRKEMKIEQLILLMQAEGIQFTQHPSLVSYPVIEFIKYIAKICNDTIEIEPC
ncbi:hypothetical protein COM11_25135 [Bacillus pseudomycoides]|uniref:hypothetical protein n=1 Tax=Bacillus pseudomycoides TaxID=64104 RepID=UPI000BF6C3F4|nr:hypothetical protein [Bacillus pseudomycoides]PGC23564.1 hypothetical protein COM11_25135 [Bacillus pseudomycoides]